MPTDLSPTPNQSSAQPSPAASGSPSHRSPARRIAYTSVFAALIIVLGLIPPLPVGFLGIPIVVQNMGIMLTALILGVSWGTLSVGLFMLLACTGLPILPGGRSGLVALTSPTVGFFVGYLCAAVVIALISRWGRGRHAAMNILACIIGGIVVNYACGVVGLMTIGGVSFRSALLALPVFLPGDIIKAVIAGLTAAAVLQALPHVREQ